MNRETKTCQNCKNKFTIEPEDFDFYAKIKVPAPTFCSRCRFQRRLIFRNERTFYKRSCGLCGQSVVTLFSPDKPYTVYCQPCWWSDKWDAGEYAMEYDPQRGFFEQFRELQEKTPYMSLINSYSTLVNSDYVNHVGTAKNCYLIFNSDYVENVSYGVTITRCQDSMDMIMLEGSQLCYEVINGERCYRVFFSEDCASCTDVYFSKDLVGCNNCFGCANLRNKNYHIFNKPYTKEDYERKLKECKLDSFASLANIRGRAYDFWLTLPRKFIHGLRNRNVSGDYIYDSKNVRESYQAQFAEDAKFSQLLTLKSIKGVYDFTEWGNGVERVYDSITVGEGAYDIKFCFGSWAGVARNEYSLFAVSSSDCFGCANVKKKQYCILNKQYREEEYKALREQIIRDMEGKPYMDKKGRVWKYGEFFPYDLSLFDYNESTAAQYFPLVKSEALEQGLRWRDPTPNYYEITIQAEKIPDSIHEVNDSIVNEVLGCGACGRAFRLVKAELELLRRFGFPIPRKCPDCRHRERMGRLNPSFLWERKCAKCSARIQTSYAPDRPEIVYCEQCYNAEIA